MRKNSYQGKAQYILLGVFLMLILTSCNNGKLQGIYSTENKDMSFEFYKNGSVTSIYEGSFLQGKYENVEGNIFKIMINGDGVFYLNTVFTGELEKNKLIINGGRLENTIFIKE